MSVRVRAEALSKRFHVLIARRTLLRTIKAVSRGESLRREHWVLKNLSFEINRGDKVALIGTNGSGKTTLLRILAGIYDKTSGRLLLNGAPRALFDCSAGMLDELSVAENIYLFGALHGLPRSSLARVESSILERAKLTHLAHSTLKDLSAGQSQRLALAVFSETPSDFLILDEVVANVDHGLRLEFDQQFSALADPETTLIMTSHDPSILRKLCDKALWLQAGQLHRFGPVDEVIDEYEASFAGPDAGVA